MSSNAEQTQSEGFPNSLDTGKLHTSSEVTQPRTELYLDELTDGASGTIIVMICRSWDVLTIIGRYLSTDFFMSDAKGNAIHSTAKANVAYNFLRLKEGSVYSIINFVVQANKEEYRIFTDHAYMIELDGATSVRKTSVKGGGCFTNASHCGYNHNEFHNLQMLLDMSQTEDEVSLSQAVVHADYSQAKEGTLENLLI
ncbi:RNA-directed DNA polymerase, eukaryota [Tanacetum coccineum]